MSGQQAERVGENVCGAAEGNGRGSAPSGTSGNVLLAGVGTPGIDQHHQRDMYLPALRAMDIEPVGVWTGTDGTDTDDADGAEAAARAAALGVEPVAELARALDRLPTGALVIACPDLQRIDRLTGLLAACSDRGLRVLLDKPTVLEPDQLTTLAERFGAVMAGHHVRHHPSLTTAVSKVRAADLGLLHAVHGELLVADPHPHPRGELRNLAVYALDAIDALIGPVHGRGRATVNPPGPDGCGETITLTLRCLPDVAVTLLVGRVGGDADPVAGRVHRYRILGSHGQLLVDLDGPALDLYAGARTRVPFGQDSVQRMLQAALHGTAGPDLRTAAQLGTVLDALRRSAETSTAVDF